MKAFSWRAVSESSEKFQPTTSRKSLDSVLEQLHWFQRCLVYCLCVVLFVRRGYKDFQEAGNNRGLLHSCGIICTTEPQTIFFTLGQLKSNSSMSLHPSGLIKCNISTYKCCCATINIHLSSQCLVYAHDHWPSRTNSRAISILGLLC